MDNSYEVLRVAVGGYAKALRESLRTIFGKRVSLRWVYYQTEPPRDVRRLDPYGAFWRIFVALWDAHRVGAEFLWFDLCRRVEELRARGSRRLLSEGGEVRRR